MYCPNFNDEFYKELSERFSKDAAYLFNTRLESPEIKDWLTKDIKIHFQGNDVIIENANGAKWDFGKEIKELNLSNKEDNNKIAVSELFKTNSELANSVYEALGFKVESEKWDILPNSIGKVIEIETNDGEYYKAKITSIEKRNDNSIFLKAKTLKGKEYSYLIDLQGQPIGSKQHFQWVDTGDIWKAEYKYNLTSQQKQQAQQLYSQYLEQNPNGNIEGFKQWNNRQQQINELFESNPELANAVYATLGFKQNKPQPTGTINVYWGQSESETSTRILSNLAPRKFIFEGREYGSVEHAYQSNKSGTFDEATYEAYNKIGGYGRKIRGKGTVVEMKAADSLGLMKKLVTESFKQNPNSETAKKLLQYENFTHNTNELIDKAFLEGLKLAQQELLSSNQITSEQKQKAIHLYSQYLDTNPQTKLGSKEDIEGFKEFTKNNIKKENIKEDKIINYTLDYLDSKKVDKNVDFSNKEFVNNKTNEKQIKEGVSDMFEENPELSNAVYEALGFKTNKLFTKISTNLESKIQELPNKDELKVFIDNQILGNPRITKELYGETVTIRPYNKDKVISENLYNSLQTRVFYQLADWYKRKSNNYNKLMDILLEVFPNMSENDIQLAANYAWVIEEAKFDVQEDVYLEQEQYALSGKFIPSDIVDWKSRFSKLNFESYLKNAPFKDTTKELKIENQEITPQQKQQAQQLYSQYLDSLNKPNTNPILQNNQQEQVKKFAELQERLNNKEFVEGAKNAFKSSEELQQFGTQEEYNDYIARVSLGILKNPSNGEYNYTSKIKDIVYHGTDANFDKFDLSFEGSNEKGGRGKGINFTRDLEDTDLYGDIKMSVILNAQNKVKTDSEAKKVNLSYIDDVDEIVVYNPEQIHILGSKQDVEGFKEFIKNNIKKENIVDSSNNKNINSYENQISNYKESIQSEYIDGISTKEFNEIGKSILPSIAQEYLNKGNLDSATDTVFLKLNNSLNNFINLQNKGLDNLSSKEQAFLDLYNIKTIEELNKIIPIYQNVIDNRFAFNDYIKNSIKTIAFLKKSLEDNIFLEQDNKEIETNLNSVVRELDKSFDMINIKDTASPDFKLFLYRIKDTYYDENGIVKQKNNILGLPNLVDADELFKKIQRIAVSTEGGFDNIIEGLRRESKHDSSLLEVIEKLTTEYDSKDRVKYDYYNKIKNEFRMLFDVANTKHEIILYQPKYIKGTKLVSEYKYVRFNSNAGDAVRLLTDNWSEGFLNSKFTKLEDGKLIFNREELNKFKEDITNKFKDLYSEKEINKDKFIDIVNHFFNTIGIPIDSKLTERLIGNKLDNKSFFNYINYFELANKNAKLKPEEIIFENQNAKYIEDTNSLISKFFKHFDNIEEGQNIDEFELYNPIKPQKSDTLNNVFKNLARVYFKNSPNVGSDSYTNVNGDMVQSIQQHTEFTLKVNNLKYNDRIRNERLSTSFSENSLLLKDFEANPDKIQISFIDGLNRQHSSNKGMDRVAMNDLWQDMFNLRLYTDGSYIMPTHSDRKVSPILTWIKPDISIPNFIRNQKGFPRVGSYDKETSLQLRGIYLGELNRIVKFQNEIKAKLEEDGINNAYYKGADKFFLNPYLNYKSMKKLIGSIITEEEFNKVWYKGGDKNESNFISNSKDALEVIDKIIQNKIVREVNETYKRWVNQGAIFYDGDKISGTQLPSNYMRYNNKIKWNNDNESDKIKAILYAAHDFVIGTTIANSEMFKAFYGDMAHFYSGSVKSTIDNFQKRESKFLSPHKMHNNITPTSKVITVKEFVVPSEYKDKYKEYTGSDAYNKIKVADGQEWGTMKEAITTKFINGRLSKTLYDSILNKILKSEEDKSYYYELSEEEKQAIFNSDKQVYVQDTYLPDYDIINPTFRKTNINWLMPEITKGTPIDDIRIGMEKKGIDRLCCESGEKLGTLNIVNLYDENGKLNSDNIINASFGRDIRELDRQGLGQQLDMPVKKDKVIQNVSQADKFMFVDIPEDTKFNLNGKALNTIELRKEKERIVSELYKDGLNRIMTDLGIEDENSVIEPEKLYNKLNDFMVSNGWESRILDTIQVNDKGEFELPLYLNNQARKIEQGLLSMFRNGVISYKVPGFISTAISGFGTTTIKDYSDLTDKEKAKAAKNLITVEGYDFQNGLHHNIIKDDGSVTRSQIIVSWNFRDSKGNLLDINNYTKIVNGRKFIDLEKIDPELLNVITSRVPLQGHSNISPAEIVGFLPDYTENALIASKEWIVQMGHDFDADEFHTYRKSYYIEQDGSLRTINRDLLNNIDEIKKANVDNIRDARKQGKGQNEEVKNYVKDYVDNVKDILSEYNQINNRNVLLNEYIDTFNTTLLHKDVIKQVLMPLDKDDLKNEAAEMDKLAEEKDTYIPLFWSYQRDSFNNQQIGKNLIASSSLFGQFLAVSQQHDIKIKNKDYYIDMFKDEEGNDIVLTNFSNIIRSSYNGSERTKATNIAIMQSLFTDYAKSPIGKDINLNDITAPALFVLSSLDNGKSIINLDYGIRFLTQPILFELVKYIKDNNVSTFNIKSAVDFLVNKYKDKTDDNFYNKSYTKDELTNSRNKGYLSDNYETIEDKEFWNIQLKSLDTFNKLYTLSNTISKLRKTALSSSREGAGKQMLEAYLLKDSLKDLYENQYISGLDKLVGKFDENGNLISSDTQWGNAIINTVSTVTKHFGQYFPYESKVYKGSLRLIEEAIGRQLYKTEYQEIWNGLKSFIYSGMLKDLFGIDSSTAREDLLHTNSSNNITKRYYELYKKYPEIANNYFINSLITNSKGDLNFINFRFNNTDGLGYNRNILAFRDILLSDNKEIANFGKDLIIQQFLRGNIEAGNGYGSLFDIKLLKSLGITDKLRSIDFNNEGELKIDVNSFVDQYIRNNSYKAPDIKDFETIPNSDGFDIHLNTDEYGLITKANPNYIYDKIKDKLYYKAIEADDYSTYIEVSKLGDRNIVEYENGKYIDSLIKKNKVETSSFGTFIALQGKKNTAIDKYEDIKVFKDKNTKDTLKEIKTNSDNEYFKKVAEILEKDITDLPVKIDLDETNFRGRITANDITIAPKGFYKSKNSSRAEYEEVFLHEGLHNRLNALSYELLNSDGTINENNISKYGSKVASSYRRLNELKNLTLNHLKETNKELYNRVQEAFETGDFDTDTVVFNGLKNLKEFISESITNKDFQKVLNDIKIEDKSLLSKVIDWISNIVVSLGKHLGIEVNKDSVLEQSVKDILTLTTELDSNHLSLRADEIDFAKPKSYLDLYNKVRKDFLPFERDKYHTIYSDGKTWEEVSRKARIYNSFAQEFIKNDIVEFRDKNNGKDKWVYVSSKNMSKLYQTLLDNNFVFRDDYSVTINQVKDKLTDEDVNLADTVKNKIIEQLKFDKEMLERRYSQNMNNDDKLLLASRINDIKDNIKILGHFEDKFEAIRNVAENQLNSLVNILNKDSLNSNELKYAETIIDNWNFNHSRLYLEDIELKDNLPIVKMLQEISNISNIYEEKLLNRTLNWALDLSKELIGKDDINAEDLKYIKETGFSSYFLDASHINHPLVSALVTRATNANRNSESKISDLSNDIRKAFNKIKSHKDLNNLLLEKDKNGDYTGKLVSRYSTNWREYFYIKQKQLNNLDETFINTKKSDVRNSILVSDLNQYYFNKETGLDANTILVNHKFFVNDRYSNSEFKNKKEYIKYLEDNLGKEHTEEIIAEVEDKISKFKTEYKNSINLIKDRYEDIDIENIVNKVLDKKVYGRVRSEFIKRELKDIFNSQEELDNATEDIEQFLNWYKRNNIDKFVEDTIENKIINDKNAYEIYSFEGENEFLVRVPKRVINEKESEFYSKQYDAIFKNEANSDIKDFYNFYTSKTDEFLSYLPAYLTKNLDKYFLANVSKDLREVWHDDKLKGIMKYYNEKTINLLCNTEIAELVSNTESKNVIRKPFTNEEINTIPLNYLKNNLNNKDKSFNLPMLLEVFGAMAIHYNHRAAIENDILMMNKLIQDAREIKYKNNNPITRNGETVTVDNKSLRVKDNVKYTIEHLLYDKALAERSDSKTKIFSLNPIEQHKKAKLARELENKRDEIEAKGLEDYEKEELMKPLIEEYRKLNGKSLQYSKVLDALNKFTTFKGLALSISSGANNLGFGFFSNLIYANGRNDFTTKEYLKASHLVMKALTTRQGITKLMTLVNKYNVLFEVNEIRYGKTKERGYTMINKLDPMMFQTKTELFNQTSSMVAQMLHQKVKVGDKEIPLYYAYNEVGNLIEGIEEGWDNKISTTNTGNKFTKLRNQIIQVNKIIHGNYDPNSPMEIKKTDLGKTLMMFRSWMPEGFAARFQNSRYDAFLNRDVKGRYRTYVDLGVGKSLSTLMKQIFYSKNAFIGKDGKALKPVDIENMRRNLSEIIGFATLISLGALIKAAFVNEDEEDNATSKFVLNTLYRTTQDVKFYVSPTTFSQLMRDPVPLLGTFRDFGNAINSTLDYINGKDFKEGTETPSDKWMRAFPITSGIKRLDYQTENLLEDINSSGKQQ